MLAACARHLLASLILGSAALAASPSAAFAQGIYAVRGPWVDDRGQAFDLASLRDSYTVVTMAYGACRRVCSLSLRVVEQIAAIADRRQLALHVLVVGIDPSQDKPADWAALRAERGAAWRGIEVVSGTPASTRRLAQQLGVHYWRYGEHTMHDFKVVLISPEGRIVGEMTRFGDDLAALLP